MAKGFLKILVYFFIGIGILLFIIAIVGIKNDHVIHLSWLTDWAYLKKIAETCAFLAIPWNIAGVFLLYLTLNIQQQQFEKTDSSIRRQEFETTFFNMLNVLTNIKKSIYFNPTALLQTERIALKDQEFFDYALQRLKGKFKKHYDGQKDNDPIKIILNKVTNNEHILELEANIIRDDLNGIYLNFYKEYHSYLGHYFRYVYNLIKFAINKRGNDGDEKEYIDLIQAQLTNDELSLIFYNVISDNGLNTLKEYKFHKWLDEYNFFENIDQRSLSLREHHILYPKTRFKFLNADELNLKS